MQPMVVAASNLAPPGWEGTTPDAATPALIRAECAALAPTIIKENGK